MFAAFEQTGSAYGVVGVFKGRRFPKRAYGGAWAGEADTPATAAASETLDLEPERGLGYRMDAHGRVITDSDAQV